MTRETLEGLVLAATARSDKLSLIRQAINLGVEDLSTAHLWSDLQVEDDVTLLTNAASVDLATDVARVSEVRVIDGTQSYEISIRPKTWLVSKFPNPAASSTGRPAWGYLEGTTLFVVPLASADYIIRYTYYRLHPSLDTATDSILIRNGGAAVAAFATSWVFNSVEKHTDADAWMIKYGRLVQQAIRVDKANSAIQYSAEPRPGYNPNTSQDYWTNPLARRMP